MEASTHWVRLAILRFGSKRRAVCGSESQNRVPPLILLTLIGRAGGGRKNHGVGACLELASAIGYDAIDYIE